MRRCFFRPIVLGLVAGACTFTSGTADGLPGVPGSTADQNRAQFAAVMVVAVRGTLDSWAEALRRRGTRTLLEHYTADAAVVQPGSGLLKGADGVGALASALASRVNDGQASLLDIEVSEGIAYVYGAYDLAPAQAGVEASRGYHVTVLRQRGEEWRIRTQLFDERTAGQPILAVPGEMEIGLIDLGTTASGTVPRAAFAGAVTLLAGFSRAWTEQDAGSVRGSFAAGALLQLPDAEIPARGSALPEAVDRGLARWRSLETTELDFTASGRLAVLLGRYTVDAYEGGSREGHYVLVVARDGNEWRIRSLVLE